MNSGKTYLVEQEHDLNSLLETWRPILGYDGYEVSDLGRVRSMNYSRSGKTVVLKLQTNRDGYRCVTLLNKAYRSGRLSLRVHNLVLLAFVGERPEKHDVNHKNGIKTDNRLENLEYVTERENTVKAYAMGLIKPSRGEGHYKAKLNNQKIVQIFEMLKNGYSQTKVARIMGTTQQVISDIKRRKKWAHVEVRKEVLP